MKFHLSIKNGLSIRYEFGLLKMLLNKLRAKLRVGELIRVENNETAKIIGIANGYYPEVSYDVMINGRLDERRESALVRLMNEKISEND